MRKYNSGEIRSLANKSQMEDKKYTRNCVYLFNSHCDGLRKQQTTTKTKTPDLNKNTERELSKKPHILLLFSFTLVV